MSAKPSSKPSPTSGDQHRFVYLGMVNGLVLAAQITAILTLQSSTDIGTGIGIVVWGTVLNLLAFIVLTTLSILNVVKWARQRYPKLTLASIAGLAAMIIQTVSAAAIILYTFVPSRWI